ncbi:MAG TPA: hypothetical protein VOA00_02580 [Thermoanaerobaculia bacterium]|jgi:hypothetical protein|nr:hypothetical protein [Thermoanaerobaculia bacterium]HXM78094.1 hypothetical protein [Thermoanaerobaculia bacterium]
MNHHPAAAILAAALLVPCVPASAETDRPPDRPERPSHLLTVGRAYSIEAKGCESRVTHFHVTAIQPIDRSKSDKDQILNGVFFRKRDITGHSGWRNVGYSADGRSVEFDLYAEGAGQMNPAEAGHPPRCESPSLARAVVDVEAWVFD